MRLALYRSILKRRPFGYECNRFCWPIPGSGNCRKFQLAWRVGRVPNKVAFKIRAQNTTSQRRLALIIMSRTHEKAIVKSGIQRNARCMRSTDGSSDMPSATLTGIPVHCTVSSSLDREGQTWRLTPSYHLGERGHPAYGRRRGR